MIIHEPHITQQDGTISVSARVDFERPVDNIPAELWFSFPERYSFMLSSRSDAFLTGLLLPAMCLGEDIEIRGEISSRLLYGLEQYKSIFHIWMPYLREININARHVIEPPLIKEQKITAAAFSGGVDSFYTLKKNLSQPQSLKAFQITHCIFAQGLDLSLADMDNYENLVRTYSQALAPLGLELIPCRTNIQAFSAGRLKWDYVHGSALGAIAQVLGEGLAKFFIPSPFCYLDLVPWGSSPVIDHLLSTETLQIIHHGAGIHRIRKLEEISDWEIAQNTLRVCTNSKKRDGVKNCSNCEKCRRTMLMLKVNGLLSKFHTFHGSLPVYKILTWLPIGESEDHWCEQTMEYARQHGKWRYIPLLWIPRIAGLTYDFLHRLIPKKVLLRLKKVLFPVEKNIFSQVYLEKQAAEKDLTGTDTDK